MYRFSSFAIVLVLASLAGCGGESFTAPDASGSDGGPGMDAAREDGAIGVDTGPIGVDTGPIDDDGGPIEIDGGVDSGPPVEPCTAAGTSEDVSCGRCGTVNRFCTADLVWVYGDCSEPATAVCDPGTTSTGACGLCGSQPTRCTATCTWEAFGACTDGPGAECMPGAVSFTSCGTRCGTQPLSCDATCHWAASGACVDAPTAVCDPGTTSATPCGMCGAQPARCTTACVWEASGACTDGPGAVCMPGTTSTQSCGTRCGTEPVTCGATCQWAPTPGGACVESPTACVPGTSGTAACGMCGTQATFCTTSCAWTPIGACTGEGSCVPGASTTRPCAGGSERGDCTATCTWSWGACVPATDMDGDGYPYTGDCDDTDPTVFPSSTRACGSFRCGGSTVTGTRTCEIGGSPAVPRWTACVRPSACTLPSCSSAWTERRTCPTECLPGSTESRSCSWSGSAYVLSGWSGCGAPPTRAAAGCPASITAVSCGTCGEGFANSYCNGSCVTVTSACEGEGCTPGATTRSTDGCPAGQYRESTCTLSCTPGAPTACRPFPPDIDVMILVDVTGSHTSLVSSNAARLATELTSPLLTDADVRVGVAVFADFPYSGYGSSGDVPFRGMLQPTSNAALVQSTLAGLPAMSGADGPESGIQAFFELAGGTSHASSMPFTCGAGLAAGGCWRAGAQRIIVVLTDITQHNGPTPGAPATLYSPYDGTVPPTPAIWATTRDLMNTTEVGVFAIVPASSGFEPPVPQFNEIALGLGQDPAQAVVTYPSGSTDLTTAIRTVATNLRTYVGL